MHFTYVECPAYSSQLLVWFCVQFAKHMSGVLSLHRRFAKEPLERTFHFYIVLSKFYNKRAADSQLMNLHMNPQKISQYVNELSYCFEQFSAAVIIIAF